MKCNGKPCGENRCGCLLYTSIAVSPFVFDKKRQPAPPSGQAAVTLGQGSVSYTHLDVYKRQVQLDGCRVACNDAGTKGVDDALQDDVAHRDKALLQDAGYSPVSYTHLDVYKRQP